MDPFDAMWPKHWKVRSQSKSVGLSQGGWVGGAGERGPPNEMRTTKKVLNVTFVILFAFWQIITALNTNSLFRSLREQVFEDGNYHGWFFLSIVSKKNLVNIECPTQSGEHWQRRYDAKVWIVPRCNVLARLLFLLPSQHLPFLLLLLLTWPHMMIITTSYMMIIISSSHPCFGNFDHTNQIIYEGISAWHRHHIILSSYDDHHNVIWLKNWY